jgi:hypothetical protein
VPLTLSVKLLYTLCVTFKVLMFCYYIQGTTVLLPGDGSTASSFVAQAIKMFQQIQATAPQIEELEESEGETGPAETSEMSPLIPDSDLGANFSLQRHKNKI